MISIVLFCVGVVAGIVIAAVLVALALSAVVVFVIRHNHFRAHAAADHKAYLLQQS